MSRFIGVQNNRISIISDKKFYKDNITIIELSDEYDSISSNDLIINYRVKDGVLINKNNKKLAKDMKIALVGNWKMQCGIATYSENLWSEVIKHVGDFKMFIEHNNMPTGPLNEAGTTFDDSKVVSCWRRGESLTELVRLVKEYEPDIVWIQHEFGLWSNACYWISMMNQLSEYRVIVTMHSIFHHKDKTICEAAIPEIITHLQGGADVLKIEKGIPGKVHVIPHGCYDLNLDSLWNFYKTEHTIVQFGFLFRYKGWQNVIQAVALLKAKYPDIFFTGLCSESQFNKAEHQIYYNELMHLVDSLGIQENVGLIRGFQSEQSLDSYLRTNKVAIFPYVSSVEHEVFGASGASRFAMSKGLPVITSSVNHFQDIPSIKADSPEEIAKALDVLFTNPVKRKEQIDKQIEYVKENSWTNVALKHIKVFES